MTNGELQKIVPDYRKVRVAFYSKYGQLIVFPENMSIVQDEIVTQTIGEIEDCLEHGLTFLSGGLLSIVRQMCEKHGMFVYSEKVSSLTVKHIIEQVRNKALDFVNKVINEQNQQEIEKPVQLPKTAVVNSMSEFTYKTPKEAQFLKGLIAILESKDYNKIVSLLANAKCTITHSEDYARYCGGTIWDAYATTICFAIPPDEFSTITKSISAEDKRIIRQICNELMPKDSGLEVITITFAPSLEEPKSATIEIEKTIATSEFVNHETDDPLLQEHIKEINKKHTWLSAIPQHSFYAEKS